MAAKPCVLVFDIGTTGAKAALLRADGELLRSVTRPYSTHYPHAGWAEQRAEDWWRAVVAASQMLLGGHPVWRRRIAAVGLSGQMMGCLPVSGDGTPLRPSLIHSDVRSERECRRIGRRIKAATVYRIAGNRLDPRYTLSKMAWVQRAEPAVYRRAALFLQAKDFVGFRLTGEIGVTDPSDASLTGVFDLAARQWSDELIEAARVSRAKLPDVRPSAGVRGAVTREAAEQTGLPSGLPVIVGGGDGACATLGAGVVRRGQAYNYLGGTSWISAVSREPVIDPQMRLFNLCDLAPGKYNVLGTVQCAGSSYEWFADQIGQSETRQAAETGADRFELLNALAAEAPPGCKGLVFLPYLMGERATIWDANARGVYFGLTLRHTRADLARAVLEGVACALRSIMEAIEECGVPVRTVRLIGGGAEGNLWPGILGHTYGKRVAVVRHPEEATCIGAGLAAGVGARLYDNWAAAARALRVQRELRPDPGLHAQYRKLHAFHRSLYPRLKRSFADLARLTSSASPPRGDES
ncbi:MAG: FGGY-family carbohydrate kinase [Armatimonadota bacterium]